MNGLGCATFFSFFFGALSVGAGLDDTSFVFGFARSSAEPCQLRGFLDLSETFNEFRSSSVSDKFPPGLSLIRSLDISACARGFGFSFGLLILAGLVFGFIKPFLAALSMTSCAVSTGFCNRKQKHKTSSAVSFRRFQAPVVRRLDNAIYRINRYSVDKC